MPKGQYQKRMNRGSGAGATGGGASTPVIPPIAGLIPETISATSGNTIDTAGRQTHAVLASSNPGANEVLLKTDSDGQIHLQGAEFDQTSPTTAIFQEDGIAIIGGSLAIVPGSGQLAAAVDSADTTIDFGKAMTPGDWVIIRGVQSNRVKAVEYVLVGSLVLNTTYNVTRDVIGSYATDPAWPKGMPFAVLGAEGAGRLWMTTDPPRYQLQTQGATASAYTNILAIGDLDGGWGYSGETFGMALGEYDTGKANLTWDPTNGLRIRRHTDTLFQVDNNGHATIAGWELDPGHLAKNGVILNSAGYLLLGTGTDIIRLDAQDATYRLWAGAVTGADAPFSVTKAGAITATAGAIGGWALGADTITGGNIELNAAGRIIVGTGAASVRISATHSTLRLWAGAEVGVNAPFQITTEGAIKATAGAIGGWAIAVDGISGGAIRLDSVGYIDVLEPGFEGPSVRLGELDDIVDTDLNPTGYGLYASNVFLRGDIIAGDGAVTLNQWGIEIDEASSGNAVTWTRDGNPKARILSQGAGLNVFAFSGAARPTLFLYGDGAGVEARGWANFIDLEGLYASEFIGVRIGNSGRPAAMLDVRGSSVFNAGNLSTGDVRVAGVTQNNLFFVDASTDRVGVRTATPQYTLDVNGALALYGPSGARKAYTNVAALTSYTDNTAKRIFSVNVAAGQMWGGEITISTHRRSSTGNYGCVTRYWTWVYRDSAGTVQQNVISQLADYTAGASIEGESLTNVWDGDTLWYEFQRDHTDTPATSLTVLVDGFAYGATGMNVEIVDVPAASSPSSSPSASASASESASPSATPSPSPSLVTGGVVAGHYRMLDAGTLDRELATSLFYLSEVNPSAGVYNWDIVDSWLALHPDGIIQVFFHISGVDANNNFYVYLPSDMEYWTISSGNQYARIPKYDSSTFRTRYIQFIQAFGARYDGQPVIACLGLDGESQCAKTQSGIDWVAACYGTDANAVPYRFVNNFIPEILQAYAAAFPNSVVFANCAPGGTDGRMKVYQQAVALGLGLKSSGLVQDMNSWYGYDMNQNPPTHANVVDGSYTGLLGNWDIIRLGQQNGLVTCTESAYGYDSDPLKALYTGLSYHPAAMVWHQEWFSTLLTQAQRDWAEAYIGRTTADTPGVWWARHVTAWPKYVVGSSGYYSGHGHCEFWLTQTDSTTWTVDENVTITDPTVTVRYTGTGTMTINGTPTTLDATGEKIVSATGAVTTITVTGATVTFLEAAK